MQTLSASGLFLFRPICSCMSSKLLVNTEQTSLLPPKKTTITEEYTTARCDRKHLNNKI